MSSAIYIGSPQYHRDLADELLRKNKSLETEVAELKAEVERLRKYHKLHEDHFDKVCETLSHPHYHGDESKADECRRMSE